MDCYNASNARANFFKLMECANMSHEPILVTGKNGNVILVSQEDWNDIQETLYLLSIPGMRDSIKSGMEEPLEKFSKDSWGESFSI